MTSEEVIFRPAEQSECRTLAQLYSICSDGVAEYVWSKKAEAHESLLDVGQRRYEQEDSLSSYLNCMVAEVGGNIAGMLVSFPSYIDPEYVEEDPVLAPYSKLEEGNSLYICGISFFPEHRNKQYGTQLMMLAEQLALVNGLAQLSLIVFEKNEGALKLYSSLGYKEKAREPIVAHPLIRKEGDAILMTKLL